MQNIQDAQDDLEQYTRRDCLEILGIPEITGENTDDIVKKCGVNNWSGIGEK